MPRLTYDSLTRITTPCSLASTRIVTPYQGRYALLRALLTRIVTPSLPMTPSALLSFAALPLLLLLFTALWWHRHDTVQDYTIRNHLLLGAKLAPLPTTYHLPLTTHHSPLTTHPRTAHHSPLTLTAHHSRTTYHVPLTTYYSPRTTHHLPLTTYHSPLRRGACQGASGPGRRDLRRLPRRPPDARPLLVGSPHQRDHLPADARARARTQPAAQHAACPDRAADRAGHGAHHTASSLCI